MNKFLKRLKDIVEPEYTSRNFKNKTISKLFFFWLCLRHFVRIILSFLNIYIVVPMLEITITSKCSLKCKNCISLIPLYKNPSDMDTETNIKSLTAMLDAVDQVNKLSILGGEPFLNNDLYKIINVVAPYDNVKCIIITTNGTIIPEGTELINSLKNNKVIVRISYYGKISKYTDEIIKLCQDNNIRYELRFLKEMWWSPGSIEKRHKNIKQLKKQYSNCPASRCNNIIDGKLHHCSRSSNGMYLGIIPNEPKDYLNVLQNSDKETFRKEIIKFLFHDQDYITACDYCDLATDKCFDVIPGEQ